ncbi:MAG TPA: hypothetical protein VFD92_18170 [Candidatus Binatia bacterium]|nr:hypothetical protein [Candidatus Binatia bacterium]
MTDERSAESIAMPAPTSWPLLAAAGASLALAGLVTNGIVSAVGAALFVSGIVGWFRDVLPHERHERVPLVPPALRARAIVAVPQKVRHLRVGAAQHRMRVPVEVHPYSAGARGGMIGAVVMALLAVIFGLVSHRSPWYPINLLAAAALPSMAEANTATLERFNALGLFVASAVHLTTSLIVGLLYGLILPMLPRRPLLAGGLFAPLLWTGLVWAALGVINPALDERIEWRWFVASQIGFGLVAGYVVSRSEKMPTLQTVPFAQRAGLETGAVDDEPERRQ